METPPAYRRIGGEPPSEAEYFMRCGLCGGWMDCRNLFKVIEHGGPLPHPAEDQLQ
jgi:hypothetical protein